ncbi:MAG: hypothetical protein ACJARD_001460 [Alphaproteobacteria bacterium]|jgi:hypothetical protein
MSDHNVCNTLSDDDYVAETHLELKEKIGALQHTIKAVIQVKQQSKKLSFLDALLVKLPDTKALFTEPSTVYGPPMHPQKEQFYQRALNNKKDHIRHLFAQKYASTLNIMNNKSEQNDTNNQSPTDVSSDNKKILAKDALKKSLQANLLKRKAALKQRTEE